MSILERRTDLNDKLKHILFSLRYKNNPIKLVGSASLKSQIYYGDFDMISAIDKKNSPEEIYHEFNKIIKKINNDPELYFIELKIQTNDEQKFRYYENEPLDLETIKKNYKKIDFFKIDLVIWYEYMFSDASIIYSLFNEKPTPEEYKKTVKAEIKEYEKEGNYYKVLKRKFLLYKIDGNKKKLKELTNIFNSELGLKYKVSSNLETIVNLLQYYTDDLTKERVKINLKLLHLEHYKLNDLEKHASELKREINLAAKTLSPHFQI